MSFNQEEWLKSLKVGDVVCDCKYRHLKIIDIFEEEHDGMLWDKLLTLENNQSCSALYCCGPVNHEEKIHYKAEDETKEVSTKKDDN